MMRIAVLRRRVLNNSASYTTLQNKLIRLEEAANKRPQDSFLQNEYLRELVKQGHRDLARARHESGKFATSASIVYESESSSVFHNNPQQQQHTNMGGQDLMNRFTSQTTPVYVKMVEPDMKDTMAKTIRSIVATLAVFGIFYLGSQFIIKQQGGGAGGGGAGGGGGGGFPPFMSPPKNYEVKPEDMSQKKTFADVKGMKEVKEELQEVVEYLRNPSKFTRLGGKLPKGMLLTGDPGVGKTLLAKAVAGEANVPFFYASGSEFEEMYVGVGAKRVRDLFAAARKRAPCIIFIDEIDAVGSTRSLKEQQTMKMTLNQLLVELDGFTSSEQQGVIILAATNFPEMLDPALVRPGRFDRTVTVSLPDVQGRLEILEHYLKPVPKAKDVDVLLLARATIGMTGADLANLVNIACISAASANLKDVPHKSFEQALDRIWMGNERLSQIVPNEVRECTAFHEGGHALVALLTEGAMQVHKATIVPRGRALGRVHQLPEEHETMQQSKKQYLASIDVTLAGRIAEEIIFGAENVTSGASSDLVKATNTATQMVSQFGMFPGSFGLNVVDKNSSEETKRLVEQEVKLLLDASYARVKALMTKHRKDLDKIAHALLEKETMTGEELKKLIGLT